MLWSEGKEQDQATIKGGNEDPVAPHPFRARWQSLQGCILPEAQLPGDVVTGRPKVIKESGPCHWASR